MRNRAAVVSLRRGAEGEKKEMVDGSLEPSVASLMLWKVKSKAENILEGRARAGKW